MLDFTDHHHIGAPAAPAQHRARRNYLAGQSGEAAVQCAYEAKGATCLATRWRAARAEVDLILQDADGTIVFVEVKTSRSADLALSRITAAQVARIHRAAMVYLDTLPHGALTPCRFDAAVVDQVGRVEIFEGMLSAQ